MKAELKTLTRREKMRLSLIEGCNFKPSEYFVPAHFVQNQFKCHPNSTLWLLQMALHRLFQLSSVLRSAVSLTLRRNIGISAVLFQRAKELDPVQKLFLDKIRDYNSKAK